MTNDSLSETQPTPEATPELIADPIVEAAAEPIAEPESVPAPEPVAEEPAESFADLLSEFERSHSHKAEPGSRAVAGHGRLHLRRPGFSRYRLQD